MVEAAVEVPILPAPQVAHLKACAIRSSDEQNWANIEMATLGKNTFLFILSWRA
jgi:hypothetical protein